MPPDRGDWSISRPGRVIPAEEPEYGAHSRLAVVPEPVWTDALKKENLACALD
jgi:hypothetical protein